MMRVHTKPEYLLTLVMLRRRCKLQLRHSSNFWCHYNFLFCLQRCKDTTIQQYNNTTIQLFTTFAFIFNFQRYNDTALYNFCLCFCFLLSNHSRFKISAFVQLLLLIFASALFQFVIAIFDLWQAKRGFTRSRIVLSYGMYKFLLVMTFGGH